MVKVLFSIAAVIVLYRIAGRREDVSTQSPQWSWQYWQAGTAAQHCLWYGEWSTGNAPLQLCT